MKNKNGQEEIVGFVVIVVIVSIIFLILLGLSIRQDSERETESIEIFQFLDSIMEYTTDCAISYEPVYLTLSELIDECYSGLGVCTNSREPCDVLNETLLEMIDSSYLISTEGSNKGFEFKSVYDTNATSLEEEIIFVSKGNCSSGSVRGSEVLTYSRDGKIISTLLLCG